MIDWISNWLKGIIIIVLLASFVDLILPSSSMQKYAKLVLGLLVILTIISPILSLFTESFSVNEILQNIDTNKDSQEFFGDDVNKYYNDDYQDKLLDEVEENMLVQSRQLLEKKLNVGIRDLKLSAAFHEKGWDINRLDLYVKNGYQTEDKKQTVKTIETVKQVTIDLSKEQEHKPGIQNASENKLAEEIKAILVNEWGIDDEVINVFIEADG